ncbi:hypothetical protein DYB28_002830, partial [Aphanomyces astaci]
MLKLSAMSNNGPILLRMQNGFRERRNLHEKFCGFKGPDNHHHATTEAMNASANAAETPAHLLSKRGSSPMANESYCGVTLLKKAENTPTNVDSKRVAASRLDAMVHLVATRAPIAPARLAGSSASLELMCVGNVVGLLLTNAGLILMRSGQPVLLYLVPSKFGVLVVAKWLTNGLLRKLWDRPTEFNQLQRWSSPGDCHDGQCRMRFPWWSGSRRPYLQAEKGILLMHRASSLTLAGKVHEALQDGIAAVELNRKNLRAHICVAKCCVLLGKADDAKEAYQQMDLVLRGLNPRLYPRLDDYRAQLHEGLLAVESLESLLREINRCTVANDNKGALRATEDAIAIALNSFELRMQKLKLLMILWYGNTMYISEKAKLLVNRAAALVMVGKFQEALQDGIAAVELDRTFLRAHLRVAKCCLLLGKADDAKEAYQQMDLVLRGLNPRQYPRLDDYRAQLHEGLLAVESLESLLWEINRCTVANDNKGALRATKDAMAIAIGSQELRLQKVTLLLTLWYGNIWLQSGSPSGMYNMCCSEFDKVEAYCTYLVRKSASGGIISLGIKMAVLYCRALHYHDKTEQAFEVLEQLLRVAPTNVDLLHVKRLWELMEDVSLAAYEAFNRGDCNKAVLLYTKALTLDKHHRTYNAS